MVCLYNNTKMVIGYFCDFVTKMTYFSFTMTSSVILV